MGGSVGGGSRWVGAPQFRERRHHRVSVENVDPSPADVAVPKVLVRLRACAKFTECRKGAARAADTRWLGGGGAERTNIFPWLGKKKRLTVQSK